MKYTTTTTMTVGDIKKFLDKYHAHNQDKQTCSMCGGYRNRPDHPSFVHNPGCPHETVMGIIAKNGMCNRHDDSEELSTVQTVNLTPIDLLN